MFNSPKMAIIANKSTNKVVKFQKILSFGRQAESFREANRLKFYLICEIVNSILVYKMVPDIYH